MVLVVPLSWNSVHSELAKSRSQRGAIYFGEALSRTCFEGQYDMKTENIRYDADGLQMIGHFAYDEKDSKKRPAVLIFPEAFGLGDHAKKRAERIAAELGYAAMACDLHGEQKVIGELDQVMALLQPLRTDAAKVRARAVNALNALRRWMSVALPP
jgi:dienelactone hydrolase